MKPSVRNKMLAIGATAAAAFLLVVVVGWITGRRVDAHLQEIEDRQVPMLSLGPRLQGDLDAIRSGLEDAVAAQDPDALLATQSSLQTMTRRIDEAADSMEPGSAASLRSAVDAYYRAGFAVSRRLIRGETGEAIVDAMAQMQLADAHAQAELNRVATVHRGELTRAFDALRSATREADLFRFVTAMVSLGLVMGLCLWVSRIVSSDELGELARGGNEMAAKLDEVDRRHQTNHWIGSGRADLMGDLQGDLSPSEVAQRTIHRLAKHLSVPAGAFYVLGHEGRLELLGRHGLGADTPTSFALGEGLLGAAALDREIVRIDLPSVTGERLISATLNASPSTILLVPMFHQGQVNGVVELLFVEPPRADALEFLASSREPVGATLEVAFAREARRELLERAQRQAARLAENEENLSRANRELAAANDELRAQTAELDSFTYSVSHDLRAPLRAIDGFARILAEDYMSTLDEEGQRLLDIIVRNTSRMGTLLDDLLAFSRLGRQPLHTRPLDMAAMAREAFEDATRLEPERQIELEVRGLPEAHGDAALLHQVWTNLVSNAVKYTRGRDPSIIEIDGRSDEDETCYFVKDNGVGFDMRYADKLFGVFQRLHASSEFEGTGVGLALVARIVTRHGGRIWADAKVGEGATFAFALPRLTEVNDES